MKAAEAARLAPDDPEVHKWRFQIAHFQTTEYADLLFRAFQARAGLAEGGGG